MERVKILIKFGAVLLKMVYAFLYQEEHIPTPGFPGLLIVTAFVIYIRKLSRMKKCNQRFPRFSLAKLLFRSALMVCAFQYACLFFVPVVNKVSDLLTGFKQTSHELNWSTNLYPGHSFCKYDMTHSMWHEASANALVDLIFLCDYTNKLVIKYIR